MALSIPDRNPGDAGISGDVDAIVVAVNAGEAATTALAATVAGLGGLGGTLVSRSDMTWNLLKHFGTALGEGVVADDHAALQDFLDACGTAGDAVGVIPPAPSGAYLTTGELVLPAYAQIQGPDPAVRYFGLAASSPRTAGAIQLAPGSSATAMIRPDSTFTAGSIRDLVLLGDNRLNASAQPVHGIWFDVPDTEHSLRAENVAIIGMTGDGIRGTLWVQRWSGLYVGGCKGYGLSITGTDRVTDVWVQQSVINGCRSGGINVDSDGGSGGFHVTGRTRVERSGWDPATSGLASGATAGAPGVRIRGNLLNSSFDITTDANSGPGVSIVRSTGRSIHDLKVSGVLARDGWYDMTTGGDGDADPQPGLEIVGYAANSVDHVNLAGLSITGGKANDDGSTPAYYHPAVGAAFDGVSFLTWPDAHLDAAIATPVTVGALDLYRSTITGRVGDSTLDIGPVYASAADLPGAADQPPAVLGMTGLDTSGVTAQPIWYDGTDWVAVAAGGGAPTGSAGGSLAGTYPNPTLAADSVGASQITDGTVTDAEVSASAAIALSKLATNPLARAGHTGTQTASTISDFDTAVRTSRLDQMATPSASVALGAQKITGLADPVAAQDAASKAYVDAVAQGLDVKSSVRAASTGNLTLSGTQTVDTVALIALDRVLVKAQTAPADNGIYVVAAGAWSRAADMDAWAEVPGSFCFVEGGTLVGSGWVVTSAPGGTLGVTAVTWAQFSGAGTVDAGTGLTKVGNTLSVAAGGITDTQVSASAAIALSKLATNPLARAGHTGTQLAATVSDFDTQVRTSRLDQMATPTGPVAFGAQRITGLGTPTGSADAVTKAYADGLGIGGGANAPLNAKSYLFGDGRLESNSDVAAMVAAWASTKKALYFPAGTYFINAGQLSAPHNGAIMYGDGIGPTVISRNGTGVLLDVSGTNQSTLRQNVTVRDMTLYGGGGTGTLVRAYYTTLLDMERVLFSATVGMGLDAVQLWDSKFLYCDWENVNSTTEAAISIRSSAAASGFGTSTDNSNANRFYGCRVELSKFAAISIGRGDATGTNPHDITFTGLKVETHQARGAAIRVDNQSNMISFSQVFVFIGGFDSGFSTAINAIDWAPWQGSTLRDVNISCSGNFLASGVLINGADDTRLDAVKGELTVAPTSGFFVNVGGGVTGLSATDITTDNGTPIGPAAVSYAPVIPTSAGSVSQAYVDSGDFFNALNFLKGDGTLETDASVTSLMTAWTASEKTLYFPAGTYLINPGLLKFPFDGGIMRGDGRDATIIKKNANGILLDCSGTDDANYRSMISIHDMRLHGGDKTGSLVRCYYTKHFKMRDVWNYGNNGIGLEGVALWDSYFDSCDWEWCWSTSLKAIVLRNSNAASGFGFSADTTNALRFVGCRIETFAAGAVLIEAGTGSSSNPHDIVFIACKMESAICNGGASGHFIDVAAGADDIIVHRLYTNVGGLGVGGTKLPSIIRFKPAGNSALLDVFLSSNGDFVDLGMEVANANKLALRGIRGKYTLAPTSGNHVQITAGCADFSAQEVTSNFGAPLAGKPTSWAKNPGAPNAHALVSGDWHQVGLSGATPIATLGVGTARLAAYWFPNSATINTVGVSVTVAGEAGSLIRLFAYADDGSGITEGVPGKIASQALIADWGTVAADVTGLRTVTGLSTVIGSGGRWVWLGAAVQNVTVTQPTVQLVGTAPYVMSLGTATPTSLSAAFVGYSATGVTGAAPGTFSASPALAGSVARIAFKVS